MKGRFHLSNQVINNNLSKGHMVFCAKTLRKLLSMFLKRKKKMKKLKQVQDERVLVQMNNWLTSRKESRDRVLVSPPEGESLVLRERGWCLSWYSSLSDVGNCGNSWSYKIKCLSDKTAHKTTGSIKTMGFRCSPSLHTSLREWECENNESWSITKPKWCFFLPCHRAAVLRAVTAGGGLHSPRGELEELGQGRMKITKYLGIISASGWLWAWKWIVSGRVTGENITYDCPKRVFLSTDRARVLEL